MSTRKQTEKAPLKDKEKAIHEIIRLRRLADKGDEKAMAELREELNARPYLWEVGNVATQAEIALTKVITGGSKVLKEATNKKLADLKDELMGPAPTPLERLLVARVVVCWLQVHHADMIEAQNFQKVELGGYLQDRLDRAHRRYLSAIRTLAQVRRLLIPPVQVNIGNQQVNAAHITA